MYRTRVDSISGTKVYAGGKWLSCIGNKPVRVGDYIWTDGRCVYGNNQIPQQPLVIIAPDNEGIPIAFSNKKLYTFRKNNFKELDPFEVEDYNPFKSMIFFNDKKGNSFFNHDYNVLAGNIDDKGDIFRLTYEGRAPDYPVKVFIWKNGVIVNEIDLEPFRDATLAETPSSGESFHVNYQEKVKSYTDSFWGFIENENDWAVLFATSSYEITAYNIWNGSIFPDNGYYEGYSSHTLIFTQWHFLSPTQHSILFERVDISIPSFYAMDLILPKRLDDIFLGTSRTGEVSCTHYDKDFQNVKFPLQDGYYYRISKTKATDFYVPDYETISSEHTTYQTLDVTVFSPHNDEIFTITCSYESIMRLKKINGTSFLFAIAYSGYSSEENMADGLYFFKDGVFTLLADGYCINQRLRPMKKIKGWQNRLKEF